MLLNFVPTFQQPTRKDMSERNIETNLPPGRRNLSAPAVGHVRSAWYWPPFSGFGYGRAYGYMGGLFTSGRPYRS